MIVVSAGDGDGGVEKRHNVLKFYTKGKDRLDCSV